MYYTACAGVYKEEGENVMAGEKPAVDLPLCENIPGLGTFFVRTERETNEHVNFKGMDAVQKTKVSDVRTVCRICGCTKQFS